MFHSVAEKRYIDFTATEEIQIGQHQVLRIAGLVIHSSMVVCSIEQKLTPGAIQVIVHIELTKPGLTGSFECFVPIKPQLQTITFGLQKNTLWYREAEVFEPIS